MKKSLRKDKIDFSEVMAGKVEEAAKKGNVKQLYDIYNRETTRKVYTTRITHQKQRGHNTITTTEEQLRRWKEHFSELLNRPPPSNPPDIDSAEEDLQITCEQP